MAIQFKRMFHVNINVSDMERSIAFYERLGFTKVADMMLGEVEGEPNIGYSLGVPLKQLRGVFMRLGDDPDAPVLDLCQFVDEPAQGRPYERLNNIGICRVCFLVDNLEAVYAELQAMGVEFVAPMRRYPVAWGTTIGVVCFKDPDGTVIELMDNETDVKAAPD